MKKKFDVVYLVKNALFNDELKYSLRSVVENFEYNKVWFYGGRPLGLVPDEYIRCSQGENSKWANTTKMLFKVCRNEDITEDFWLFNDDFFIMKPFTLEHNVTNGTLEDRIKEIEGARGGNGSRYTANLKIAKQLLEEKGLPTKNYAVHIPMLVNRRKALEALTMFPECPMFRSLYGNYVDEPTIERLDVKKRFITDEISEEEDLVSTEDKTFQIGQAGQFIRDRFRSSSRYEHRN